MTAEEQVFSWHDSARWVPQTEPPPRGKVAAALKAVEAKVRIDPHSMCRSDGGDEL